MSADEIQVGGQHYKDVPEHLQHWNVVPALEWDYFIGAATKYIWRLGKKGDATEALKDIDKSIHYLQKKRELMAAALAPVGLDTRNSVSNAEAEARRANDADFMVIHEAVGGPATYRCVHCGWQSKARGVKDAYDRHGYCAKGAGYTNQG